ncbi:hypothetical protein [uncultured Friedmanniella sp.]|uniref:hypothetical protein n=1 Tax=uncultured Friedmanniella sp. TaxID=335381 RepID=UPI0035CC4C51
MQVGPTSRPLWVGALRSRLAVNALLLLLATVAVLTASLGPLLVRSIQQSSVADTIASMSPAGTAVTVGAAVELGQDPALFEPVVTGILAPTAEGHPTVWNPPATWGESTSNLAWATPEQQGTGEKASRARLVDAGCPGLVITAGSCPEGKREVLVSTDDAAAGRIRPGTVLNYRISQLAKNVEGRVTVAGLYDPERTAAPLTRPGGEDGAAAQVTGDPMMVTDALLQTMPLSVLVSSRLTVRQPVDLAGLDELRSSLAEIQHAIATQSVLLSLVTTLGDVLDRAGAKSQAAQVLVGVTEAQALGLGLFSLAVVLQRIARSRGPEWATGRLLGVRRRRRFTAVFAEPGVVLLLAAPLGLAAAVGVARLTVAASLRPDTVVEVARWPVGVAAVAAVVASLLALGAVSAPSVVQPLAEVVQARSEARRVTRLGAVAQAVVVLLAATTLYQLLSGGVLTAGGSQLGLLAPGLFALALAVLAVRLAVLVVRRVTRRASRSLVAIVVARQAARVPTSLNPAIVIAVGVALTVFATQVLALSVRNQELRADAANGATTVLEVTAPPGVDLRTAVRTADPGGRYAMAAMLRARTGYDGTDRIMAVDSERLAAVAAWNPAWSGVAGLAAALHPPTTPTIVLRGRRVQVDVASVGVSPQDSFGGPEAALDPAMVMVVDDGRAWKTVRLGTLGEISDTRSLTASIACSAGCRLVGIGLLSEGLAPFNAHLTVTGVSTDEQPAAESHAWLRDSARWHARVGDLHTPTPDALTVPTGTDQGLLLTVTDNQGSSEPLAASSDVTDPLPAVVGPQTELTDYPAFADTAFGHGVDGDGQLLHVVGTASVLPRLLGDGVLVDLGNAVGLSDPAKDQAVDQVWLAPDAPAGVEQALVAAGLRIDAHDRLADATATQLREPTTRGASVAVSLAYAGLLVSLLALVAARVADGRRRRADWSSLRDAGLAPGTVRRLAFVEIAGPPLLATVLGLASGVVALVLSAPRLPLVDLGSPGPPLDLGVSPGSLAVVGVVTAVAVLAVATVGTLLETRPPAGWGR